MFTDWVMRWSKAAQLGSAVEVAAPTDTTRVRRLVVPALGTSTVISLLGSPLVRRFGAVTLDRPGPGWH